jgi:hypothetical protein
MAAPAQPDLVAESLLRYYRNPASPDKPALRPQDLTASFAVVAKLALGKPVTFTNSGFASPIVAKTLRRAALQFIRRTQFNDDADHYALLGVAPDATMQAIRENHRLLIQIVHPDRASPDLGWPDGIAARVNRAYQILKHPDSRAAYDLQRSTGPHPAWVWDAANAGAIVRRNRPPPPVRPVLPEWLTAGVGGFVRRNPTFAIFAVLISACSLAVASVLWLDSGATLRRGEPRPMRTAVPAQPAIGIESGSTQAAVAAPVPASASTSAAPAPASGSTGAAPVPASAPMPDVAAERSARTVVP